MDDQKLAPFSTHHLIGLGFPLTRPRRPLRARVRAWLFRFVA